MPKYEGKLTIPTIKAGAYQTVPLEVEVLPAGTAVKSQNSGTQNVAGNQTTGASQNQQQADNSASNTAGSFWAELTVDNKNPYVHQEITATLVIYDQKGVELQMPTFENTQDWLIEPVDNPEIIEKNGQRIIKIIYSMVPQKSGTLSVPSARIEGTYTDFSSTPVTNSIDGLMKMFQFNINMADMLGTQKPIMVHTEPISVKVNPVPEDYGNYWWLPAESLVMQAKWSDAKPVFKVGEAVSREITVLASGVAAEDIPELSFKDNPIWKQYPEKPQLNTVVHNQKRIAQAVTRVVYIPQKSGEQEIPEITLRWYNVRTKHIETAVIPAEKFYIAGSNVAENTPQNFANASEYETTKSAENDKVVNQTINVMMQKVKFWAEIAVAFIAGLVISYMLLRKRQQHNEGELSAADWIKQVEHALKNCDYRLLRDGLLKWGEQAFVGENIANLNELSVLIGDEKFSDQMLKLSGILYAGKQDKLDDDIILNALKHKHKKMKQKKEKPLPDLYK